MLTLLPQASCGEAADFLRPPCWKLGRMCSIASSLQPEENQHIVCAEGEGWGGEMGEGEGSWLYSLAHIEDPIGYE